MWTRNQNLFKRKMFDIGFGTEVSHLCIFWTCMSSQKETIFVTVSIHVKREVSAVRIDVAAAELPSLSRRWDPVKKLGVRA